MDDDLKAVVERLTEFAEWMARGDNGAAGSVLLAASVAQEHSSDLRTLLSALRQRDEALRDMLAMYGSKYDGEMRLKESAEIEVIETARAALSGSADSGR